jgi:hypothetical protein
LDDLMTAEPEGEPTAAIEYVYGPTFIPRCGHPSGGPSVRVIDIAQVKAGWVARGEIPQTKAYCPTCGIVYSALSHYVPIECATFPCPSCGPTSKLITEILSITETETGYSFVALLKCDACSRQHRLSKLLGGLAKITRVKVGPTGVEIEVKP